MTDARASMLRRSRPQRREPARRGVRPGLRLQIVLALAGLMLLAFVPLFIAVASLARATVQSAREQAARVLGQAIAAHVGYALATGGPKELPRVLEAHARAGELDAVCVFGPDGARVACAGSPVDANAIRAPWPRNTESALRVRTAGRHALEIAFPSGDLVVVSRIYPGDGADGSRSLVRLVALYMITFALALLIFAYFVLTHLIVRPIEGLVDAADRVASGARTLRVPRVGARELVELAASVHAMAQRLISEEAALIVKVDELTQTASWLRDTQNQLIRSERMASVGHLAAGFAHEVGNPLAALLGMEDLLLAGDVPPDEQADMLRRMRSETERINKVVRDLLDFARPEQKESSGEEVSASAEVRAVVDAVVSLVRRQAAFRVIRIEAEIDNALRVVFPSPHLMQVLLNIVLNAGAAMTPGGSGGVIRIRARDVGGHSVRIEIEDTGPGVAPAVTGRLFEPFVTTKEVGEGTGLGLAVCRGLVESAGGEVGFDPAYREGARFYVVLPSST